MYIDVKGSSESFEVFRFKAGYTRY